MRAPASTTDGGIVSLRDLIDFISHVAHCYPEITARFPEDLMEILRLHHAELESELREKIVTSLVLLRKKEIIDSSALGENMSLPCEKLLTVTLSDYFKRSSPF